MLKLSLFLLLIPGCAYANQSCLPCQDLVKGKCINAEAMTLTCKKPSDCYWECAAKSYPPDHDEIVVYKTWWGSGLVNCSVTNRGHVYKCIIIKP